MALKDYKKKRDFKKTAEPEGKVRPSPSGRMFVIQKHAARRLHYDLRLEAEGVLKSWAVPKGPSYDPSEKRLAVQVEDHPIDYGDFEGIIPEGEYGGGTVMVWDRGTWTPVGDWKKGFNSGRLKFHLEGEKLKGDWTLVEMKGRAGEDSKKNWLLMKSHDDEVKDARSYDVTVEKPLSAKTGRSLDEIRAESQGRPDQTWESSREPKVRKKKAPAPRPAPPVKGRKAPWPEKFFPQLATLVSNPPEGSGWLHEIKFDGYRLIARIKNGRVNLMTRRGQDWTEKFAPIARELSGISAENAILDGEVVVQNSDGTTSFQKLQNYLKSRGKYPLLYYVFDLPYYNGHDLSGLPLVERKELLAELIRADRGRIPSVRYSEHLTGPGERIFQTACQHVVEGIVSKRADSPYIQKRTGSWLKVKCVKRQEFVVGGFTEPKGSRSYFGSLVLGYYDEEKKLIYCGNVGTGFNSESIKTIYDRLKRLEQDRSPFDTPVPDARRRKIHWTAPKMVAEVEFTELTDEGILRHPSFTGIREDKAPGEVTMEKEVPPPGEEPALAAHEADGRKKGGKLPRAKGRKRSSSAPDLPVPLSHPEKVLYPEQGLTKRDLAEYYQEVAKWMLPELAGRPLSLVRCPEGIGGECFFQKHLGEKVPKWIQSVSIREKKGVGVYPVVEDLPGLLSLVQLGALEIHAWGCRRDRLEYPDRMIFDLDPSPEISKETLVEAALFVKEWLLKKEITPFFKTTGGKGVHVVIPLKPTLDWDKVKEISRTIALKLVREKPGLFTATMAKKARTGKILIDFFRNDRGATAILPYSTRARPGAPVALPILEKELTADFLSNPPGIREAIRRVKTMKKNPWQDMPAP